MGKKKVCKIPQRAGCDAIQPPQGHVPCAPRSEPVANAAPAVAAAAAAAASAGCHYQPSFMVSRAELSLSLSLSLPFCARKV